MNIFKKNVLLSDIELRVNSCISSAVACKLDSSALSTMFEEQVRSPINQKYSNGKYKHNAYLRAYSSGYISAKRDSLVKEHVEHCYLHKGVLYTTCKNTGRPDMKALYELLTPKEVYEQCEGGMYWIGTDKLF
jgi:hypothetical protein